MKNKSEVRNPKSEISQVSVVRCKTYTESEIEESVREGIEFLGGLTRFVEPGQRVLLKPNVLAPTPPDRAVTTHPAIVKAMVKLVKEAGGLPLVGDSPGTPFANTEELFQVTGIGQAALEAGAEILQFEKEKPVRIDNPSGRVLKTLYLVKPALEVDVIISLPKLKTHILTLLTMGIKNLYGLVPGPLKSEYHRLFPQPDKFADALVDIFAYLAPKVKLTLMDAVVGMDGAGPQQGNPKEIGLILASQDMVALDVVASSIVGFDPLRIETTRIAAARKLGEADPDKITILGPRIEEVKIDDFSPPPSLARRLILLREFKPLLKLFWIKPVINQDKCTKCGICRRVCPAEAISERAGRLLINYDRCIKCFCCHEMCLHGGIDIQESLARKLRVLVQRCLQRP
ncbi:MAG: DUF362 domain-containing protein [bacterium]|nr:DUF362 domain-containing protein [bacterium]